jgi:hypothetical protein
MYSRGGLIVQSLVVATSIYELDSGSLLASETLPVRSNRSNGSRETSSRRQRSVYPLVAVDVVHRW